eukprot:TRINITY_DN498_c0_g1_i1.p1 TRINITY_DN498_c0_g1~~TRINITY_DN498_c0_g1_i1.p1  ORF type:complete len:255 (-),score=111.81 TRINITY_DN498_c0_g1_i1:156-920(-)
MSRRFFVGGNWKCNGNKEKLSGLIQEFTSAELPPEDVVDIVLAPSAIYLDTISEQLGGNRISVSAQNCHNKGGAFTGELSPDMLVDMNIPYVILGHSERRHVFGESNDLIAEKVKVCQEKGIKVIACIGEKLDEREAGKTLEVVLEQMASICSGVSNWDDLVIAYEPVWAIGTGKTASPEQAQEVHVQIRSWMSENFDENIANNIRIIYGGSVKPANCEELAKMADIDGFLVGGASLTPGFVTVINAATIKSSL